MPDFYTQVGDQEFGPYGASRLKQFATDGRVLPSDLVRQGKEGKWYPASTVKGLFSQEPVERSLEGQDASPKSTPTEAPEPADTNPNLRACPDCGTMVSMQAAACPSCGAPLLETEDSPELKACPDCGTMVSQESPACPSCGIPFWDVKRKTTPRHQPLELWPGILAAIVVGFVIFAVFMGVWPQANNSPLEAERNRQKFKQDMEDLDDAFGEIGVGPPEVPPRTEGRITSNVSYTLPARSVDELARKFFDAIKREDRAAYLDTAIPEKFTGQFVTAFPVSKQARLLDHFRTLRSRFEKKWRIEIIGRATELGIEWKQTEFVAMRVPGLKTELEFQRHGWMIIQFSHRGQDFYIELDDPTLVSGHWYFFDPMKTISTDPDTRWSRLGISVPASRRTRP